MEKPGFCTILSVGRSRVPPRLDGALRAFAPGCCKGWHEIVIVASHCSGTKLRNNPPGDPHPFSCCLEVPSLFSGVGLGGTCPARVQSLEPGVPQGPHPLLGCLQDLSLRMLLRFRMCKVIPISSAC